MMTHCIWTRSQHVNLRFFKMRNYAGDGRKWPLDNWYNGAQSVARANQTGMTFRAHLYKGTLKFITSRHELAGEFYVRRGMEEGIICMNQKTSCWSTHTTHTYHTPKRDSEEEEEQRAIWPASGYTFCTHATQYPAKIYQVEETVLSNAPG